MKDIIGHDMQTTKAACDELKAAGYVVRSKKKGSYGLHVPNAMISQLKEKLFDPAALITGHLQVPLLTQPLDTVKFQDGCLVRLRPETL
jgi:hypothetical protein